MSKGNERYNFQKLKVKKETTTSHIRNKKYIFNIINFAPKFRVLFPKIVGPKPNWEPSYETIKRNFLELFDLLALENLWERGRGSWGGGERGEGEGGILWERTTVPYIGADNLSQRI